MLSYQHLYHAGNLADVHKHSLLCAMLAYLTQKHKPLSYIETHAGRGLYDLNAPEALRTGEAQRGVFAAEPLFAPDHPYRQMLARVRAARGPQAYPGSPLIAALMLRPGDALHLAELHPQEHAALVTAMAGFPVHCHRQDGFAMANAKCPPTPRRGLMLVDPSYEVKADYAGLPRWLAGIHRKWPVGVLVLWYPLLPDQRHVPMLAELAGLFPDALRDEVAFPPALDGRALTGSGMFVVNPPFGLQHQSSGMFSRIDTVSSPGFSS